MRWFWIDKFLDIQRGKSARAVKNVALSEEHLHDHFPGYPVMPGSLIIEGMAQTGGILLCDQYNFKYLVFLAKIPKFIQHRPARPGDQLIYSATLEEAREEGGMTKVVAHCGEELVAEAEIVFAHLTKENSGLPASVDQRNVVEAGLGTLLADSGIGRRDE